MAFHTPLSLWLLGYGKPLRLARVGFSLYLSERYAMCLNDVDGAGMVNSVDPDQIGPEGEL